MVILFSIKAYSSSAVTELSPFILTGPHNGCILRQFIVKFTSSYTTFQLPFFIYKKQIQ